MSSAAEEPLPPLVAEVLDETTAPTPRTEEPAAPAPPAEESPPETAEPQEPTPEEPAAPEELRTTDEDVSAALDHDWKGDLVAAGFDADELDELDEVDPLDQEVPVEMLPFLDPPDVDPLSALEAS